ncbi:ThuA domain-containing protein [Georgenia alba]|uniref:ThuA domain-containing protein n=1 Tax=Georgenia alba TaxID=2233858 RepID=A0ABW2Q4F7_9MICO
MTADSVLVFTRTTGFRHDSIPAGVAAVRVLAADDGLDVVHTEDPGAFTPETLAGYRAVVWLSASGNVLEPDQRRAFADWLAAGGGFAGVHGASTAEPDWPEYQRIVGARFTQHPAIQAATVRVEDADHPSTAGLPAVWEHTDEWYDFATDPRGAGVRVLLTVDESTYDGGRMGEDHPVAWASEYGQGRCWYTALGHSTELYEQGGRFLVHLRGGLRSVWS